MSSLFSFFPATKHRRVGVGTLIGGYSKSQGPNLRRKGATFGYSSKQQERNDSVRVLPPLPPLPPLETSPLHKFLTFPSLTLAPPIPAVTPLQVGQRLVVIGDVHGDVEALQTLLRIANVVDPHDDTLTWNAGNTIVVQCGDIMDRGNTEIACWQIMCRLSHQAAKDGGALSVLWGNHEVMNALGLFHYTQGDEFEQRVGKPLDLHTPMRRHWRTQFAGNQPARWAAWEPGGLLAHALLANLSVALLVGRTLCVHAGLKTRHLGDTQHGIFSLDTLNQQARDWITTAHHGNNFNTLSLSPNKGQLSKEKLIALANARAQAASHALPPCLGGRGTEATSPIWMRDYSDAPALSPQATLDLTQVLKRVSAERIVMGHTPQHQITRAANGKAWRIDTAASRGMGGGPPQVLEIVHGEIEDTIHVLTAQGRMPAAPYTVS